MPAKLKFRVVHCTSEDPEFPSTELNAHSPHTVGWQSARFCDYPQEIGFQFGSPVHLMQLQVLSHQYKIASKLELFVGTCPDGDKVSYQNCKWKRLGYLSLDSNERSSWQARELKSVQLDAYGRFLKVVAHSCHTNKLNMYSQIGIIAINLIGDSASPAANAGQAALPSGAANAGAAGGGARKEISALDDLTFDLNFDPATAAQIRELHVAKDRAVRAEDYDAAKRLKEAIERLKQVCMHALCASGCDCDCVCG
jgi:centrosomal protein CEP104